MHKPELLQRVEPLRQRLAAAQVELALCVEEVFELLEVLASAGARIRDFNPGQRDPPDCVTLTGLSMPVVDRSTCTVLWHGHTCHMGLGIPFRIFERLARRPNQFVSYDQLIEHVWLGAPRSDETLRSETRRVRRILRAAGMEDLAAAIKGRHRHYGLILQSER